MSRADRFLHKTQARSTIYLALMLTVGLVITAVGGYAFIQCEFPANPPKVSPSPSVSVTLNPTLTPYPTITSVPTPISTLSVSPSPLATPSASLLPSPTPAQRHKEAANWAGYVAASDLQRPQPNVTSVSSSWAVPSIVQSENDTFSAVWIGIGGQFDQTLIQCGTEQDSIGGRIRYSAWYEILPRNAVTIRSFPVSAGDQIEASIQLTNDTLDEWTLNITDLTSGHQFQDSFFYASSRNSADWIIERPNVNNVVSTLSNFGNVTLTNCQTTIGSASGGIGSFPYSTITMYSSITSGANAVRLTDVSELSVDGTSFGVSYLTSG